ncbi:hypothetical protein [Deinococcus kurensis]|uniref:hypothetical protein n=1 Tax=Deinococcus kurensis TaxID=2662757 RepID=UPI0012D2AD98|nr:hypothetical protein [Deinococcus kurensis]
MTRTETELRADAERLLAAVRAQPGETVTRYARILNLAPTYTRKLITVLTAAGHLVPHRITVYRAQEPA